MTTIQSGTLGNHKDQTVSPARRQMRRLGLASRAAHEPTLSQLYSSHFFFFIVEQPRLWDHRESSNSDEGPWSYEYHLSTHLHLSPAEQCATILATIDDDLNARSLDSIDRCSPSHTRCASNTICILTQTTQPCVENGSSTVADAIVMAHGHVCTVASIASAEIARNRANVVALTVNASIVATRSRTLAQEPYTAFAPCDLYWKVLQLH